MTLPHNEAIARVIVDGLAICCFNSDETKWDLGFLHHTNKPAHQLILKVEGHPPHHLSNRTGLISFKTNNANFPGDFPDGFFDNGRIRDRTVNPVTPDEKENFRWVIDMADPHDVNHGHLQLIDPPFPVTRAHIENAVFYTTERSPRDLIMVSRDDDPNQKPVAPYGKTNDEIAADIFCESGDELVIEIDGEALYSPLQRREGNPWKICLTHLCLQLPPPAGAKFEKGDFHLFYAALNTERQFALWGEPVQGMVHCGSPNDQAFLRSRESGRTDCDTVRMSNIDSLDALFSKGS